MNNLDYQNTIYILFTNNNIHISYNDEHHNDNKDLNSNIKITISIQYNNIHSISINFNHNNHKINKIIDDSTNINYINNSINSIGNTFLSKLHNYIETLSPNDLSIITNEYKHYDFDIMGCLIAGICSYLSFSILNNEEYFSSILPFEIPISSENILNNPIAKLYRNILTPLSKLSTGLLKNIITFIISFLNLWENIFINDITFSMTIQFNILSDTLSSFLFNIIDCNFTKHNNYNLLEQKLNKLDLLEQKLNKLDLLEQKLNKLELLEGKLNINSLENRINMIESKINDICNNPIKLCKITHCNKFK